MSLNPKTQLAILYIPPVIFGLMALDALYVAFTDPTRAHIMQAVLWFSLSVIFLSTATMARRRHIAHQSRQRDSSNESE